MSKTYKIQLINKKNSGKIKRPKLTLGKRKYTNDIKILKIIRHQELQV